MDAIPRLGSGVLTMRIEGGGSAIPLDAFRRLEGQEGEVRIVGGQDGDPRVIASGRTPGGREVSWVRPDGPGSLENEVVGRFLDAISNEFGARITRNIARELGLEPATGKLDTRTVEQAVRMAENQRDVFSGANFFLEVHCSAKAASPAFRNALAELGGPAAEALDSTQREDIDARFRAALSQASAQNREPLAPADGERILREVLRDWLGLAPGSGA